VHLRKSNTEPIISIYTEAATQQKADELAERIIDEIKVIAGHLINKIYKPFCVFSKGFNLLIINLRLVIS
jgi:hypothetical protein